MMRIKETPMHGAGCNVGGFLTNVIQTGGDNSVAPAEKTTGENT